MFLKRCQMGWVSYLRPLVETSGYMMIYVKKFKPAKIREQILEGVAFARQLPQFV